MFTNIMHGKSALRISEDTYHLDLGPYVEGGQLRLVLQILSGVLVGGGTPLNSDSLQSLYNGIFLPLL